jgi:hypothetical protein
MASRCSPSDGCSPPEERRRSNQIGLGKSGFATVTKTIMILPEDQREIPEHRAYHWSVGV